MRCKAASTSAMTSRRAPAMPAAPRSLSSSGSSRSLRLADAVLHDRRHARRFDDLLIELAPVVADRLDLALELGLVLQRLLCSARSASSSLLALLERRRGWRAASRRDCVSAGRLGRENAAPPGPRRRSARTSPSTSPPASSAITEAVIGRSAKERGRSRPASADLCKNGVPAPQ